MVEELHVVVPHGIDDPARPSGGNRYDRRVIDELRGLGHVVHEHPVGDLDRRLTGLPDGAVVVIDGLVSVAEPATMARHSARLRLVVLLHMPFAEADPSVRTSEQATLAAAAVVVTTSEWARAWVIRHHRLAPERVWAATPGVDPAPLARFSPAGDRLLCLAAVTRGKGHDILFAALAELADLDWTCACVGALDLEPDYVAGLRELAARSGIGDRVHFTGALSWGQLDARLADTDLLVSASRHEAYGMAVTEALARGVPVVVSEVGGHVEAVTGGGMLLPPDDPDALAVVLRGWLSSAAERDRLRTAAAARRSTLTGWTDAARRLAAAAKAARDPYVSSNPTNR